MEAVRCNCQQQRSLWHYSRKRHHCNGPDISSSDCWGRKDSYLVLLEGANHFSIAVPFDPTTGRPFLDFPTTQPEDKIRSLIAETIGLFIDVHVRH